MAKIAYILLTHKDPAGVIAQATRLTAGGDYVVIHYDGRSLQADHDRIVAALSDNPGVGFVKRRIKCGWGQWSLVQATLNALQVATDHFPRATHFYMLSGDCMPIKSAEYAHAFLDRDDVDYIESVDFFNSDWIKTGIKAERLIYRHYFNERTQKDWFYRSMRVQDALGLRRAAPADLQMQIGSQWWCLRRRTIAQLLEFSRKRRDVMRFFRTTWIPDETFFQTLVRHLVPEHQIRIRPLTFLMFTDYGMPVTFYNDHFDLLISQDFLFARKISPDATQLKERLGQLYTATGVEFRISNEGPGLFAFLTGRGRHGRRFAPRFWERESSVGRERHLMMIICKKWHVARRLAKRINQVTNLPSVGYLFNEEDTPLPDLGGIQSTLEKRTRHRRAMVRMLFEYWHSDRLVLCIDPANLDLMQDFFNDKATLRLLEVECDFSDADLLDHAQRMGLAAQGSAQNSIDQLLTTIRHDVRYESDRIRDAGFSGLYRMRESDSIDENTVPLAAFLDIPPQTAREIAATANLFVD